MEAMTSDELARLCASAAGDKKARDVIVLDVRGRTTIADHFVICEGDTDRQVRAIADAVEKQCREAGIRPLHTAGLRDASWACLDFDAVIVHIFLPGERSFYDLESLWGGGTARRALP
jgi:ribosome-associated protein